MDCKGQPCCFSTPTDINKKVLLIELTNKCNLTCPYCHSIPNEGGENQLSDIRLAELIQECKEEHFETVIVSGGEPMVSKRIWTFAELIKEHGLKTDLCTNGTLVTKEIARKCAEFFPQVTVTLDTLDAETYGTMKACSSKLHARVLKGIQYLIEAGVKVGVTIVLTRYNFENIGSTIDYLEKSGVAKVSFLRLFHTNNSDNYDFDYSEDNINILLDSIRNRKIKIKMKGWNFDPMDYNLCSAGETGFAIDHEGYLLPCILLRRHSRDCDLKYSTLKDAMKSESIKKIRNMIRNLSCPDCKYNESCFKGCPATEFPRSGLLIPDERCMRLGGQ